MHSPADLPAMPPELIQLQQQRDATISKEVADLETALGTQAAATLDTFLQHDFAPTVTVKPIGPPSPHDPARIPVPTFPQEAQ